LDDDERGVMNSPDGQEQPRSTHDRHLLAIDWLRFRFQPLEARLDGYEGWRKPVETVAIRPGR
jgi:hypothetical protein